MGDWKGLEWAPGVAWRERQKVEASGQFGSRPGWRNRVERADRPGTALNPALLGCAAANFWGPAKGLFFGRRGHGDRRACRPRENTVARNPIYISQLRANGP